MRLPPGHLPRSGDIFGVTRERVLLTSSGRAGRLLNILQCTRQAPLRNYPAPRVSSDEAEKLCSGEMGLSLYSPLSTVVLKECGSELPPHSFLDHRQVSMNRLKG